METIVVDNRTVAVITAAKMRIADGQSALDAVVSAAYDAATDFVAIEKEALADEFFDLSTGIAGEVLQKFVTYQIKVALFGDFPACSSKALSDLIRESNRGRDVFFVATKEEAVRRLAALP